MKRILAMALVLCVALGAVPLYGFAETTEEEQALADRKSETSAIEEQAAEAIYALTTADTGDVTHMASKPEDGTVTGEPFKTTVSENYRIPGLVNHNGTLIATADARWDYEYDGGGSDIVVSRSTDGGNTWNYTFAGYLGDNGNVHAKNSSTLMDPLIVSDGETLYLLYDIFPAGYSLGGGSNTTYAFSATGTGFDSKGRLLLGTTYNSTTCGYYLENGEIYATNGTKQTGYTVDAWFNVYKDGTYVSNLFFADSPFYAYPTSYIAMQTSTDDGATWSDPELVNVKHDGTKWQVLGPGSGLITQDNQIAFTVYNSDSSISLVYRTSGKWNTVKTSAATNESSIVELSDGTIRAFVKNSSNVITYVDFSKGDNGYTAGSAQSTGIGNTGWCMVSSALYSKTYKGKAVILVCCPNSSDLRRYGTLYAFTADDMQLIGSYQIDTGYDDQFFAYSDMAELSDGTLAMLYEDGCLTYASAPWNGSSAGIGYSHITYTTVDLEEKLGITFDIPGEIYAADPTTNKEVTDLTLYTFNGEQTLTVNGLNTSTQTATVTSSNTSVVTAVLNGTTLTLTPHAVGTATVTVTPTAITRSTGTESFTVNITVSSNKTEEITLTIGETVTVTDNTGNHTGLDTNQEPNGAVATMTLNGVTGTTGKELVEVTEATSFAEGKEYVLVNTRAAAAEPYYSVLTAESYTGSTSWIPECTGLKMNGPASAETSTVWTITSSETGYTISVGGQYLNFSDEAASVTTTEQVMTMTYSAGNGWLIYSNNLYLSDYAGDSLQGAYGFLDSSRVGDYWRIYEVVEKDTSASTEITFTGVAVGTTEAVVGNTTYKITVEADVREILLYEGTTKTDTIEGAAYSDADISTPPAETIATIKIASSSASTQKKLVEVTAIESGKQYILFNIRAGKTLSATTNSPGLLLEKTADESNHLWTIEKSGEVDKIYTVRYGTDGGYLKVGYGSASVSDSSVDLQLDYIADSGHWLINESTGNYGLNDYTRAGTIAAGWSDAASDGGSWWTIYEIVDEPVDSSTTVTFTGVKEGKTTAVIGTTQYNITVKTAVEGDIAGLTGIVGTATYDGDNGDVELTGKPITALTIDADKTSSFQLGIDLEDADQVVWSTDRPDIVAVDENGNVSGLSEGDANVIATVYKDGIFEKVTIPVHVIASLGTSEDDSGMTTVCYYVEEVTNTTAWYSLYARDSENNIIKDELVQVTEGQVIYFQRPITQPFAMIWLAAPKADEKIEKVINNVPVEVPVKYALTYMSATGTDSDYFPLHEDGETISETAGYYATTNAYANLFPQDKYYCDQTIVDAMLVNAIAKGADGVMSMGRKANDGSPKLGSSLSFISEEVATVNKAINGILEIDDDTANIVNYRPYSEGMVASTDDIVFYTISVTQERPHSWSNEADGEAALQYYDETDGTETALIDTLEDAYFYDQALDQADGKWDGVIDWTNEAVEDFDLSSASAVTKAIHAAGVADTAATVNGVNAKVNIADVLNTAWGADEQTRTFNFTVAYKIKSDDIPRYTIKNSVNFECNYTSNFSKASKQTATAASVAKVTVVTSPMESVIVDFAQPIVIKNLSNDELKYAFGDGDVNSTEFAEDGETLLKDVYIAPTATYGDVSVVKVHRTDEDGNPLYDGDNDSSKDYPLYDYTVTYTPHTRNGVMQSNDVVQIYGCFVDTDTKELVTKVINAFSVYPATTVYYEEDYIDWGADKDYTNHGDWELTGSDTVTDPQDLDYVGDAVKNHEYGYDPIYAKVDGSSNGASNGTQATTKTTGAKGTFVFTGTGFEIYANCTEETGYVMVLVKGEDGSTRLYTVNTAVGAGDTPATEDQLDEQTDNHYYSVPIVSVQDLDYGKYTVSIIKSVDVEPKKENDKVVTDEEGNVVYVTVAPKPVYIDGIRIFQTMNPETSNQVYTIDNEKNPSFVELRDLVLTGVSVETNVTDSVYSTADSIISQVYSDTGTLNGAIVIDSNPSYVDGNLKDLLENGPKNELYLWPKQAVTFTLANSVTAQIGMKTVSGSSVNYSYSNNGGDPTSHTLNSSTDMFYHDDTTGEVTITNNSGGVLSITLLKYWVSETEATLLSEVTESQVAYAVMSLREPAVEETEVATLTVNYVTQSSRVSVSFGDKVISLPGRKIETVTLTKVQSGEESEAVFTADEIRAALPDDVVIRNLQDIQVPYGQTATRTFFASRTNQSRTAQTYVLERTF